MTMRFRPANIRLINRRLKPLRLLLALSSKNKSNDDPTSVQLLTGSLHIRVGYLKPKPLLVSLEHFALQRNRRIRVSAPRRIIFDKDPGGSSGLQPDA
jgi:hypothetical protein